MKNKSILTILLILLHLITVKLAIAQDFIFEVSDIEITNNGNTYKGNNRGKILTNNQLELISDNFEYLKKINQLKLNGNVQLLDGKNNVTINAEIMFYLKDKEEVSTLGKTLIKVSDEYTVEGYDLTLSLNEMILSSIKNVIITDNDSNQYKLENFQYSINEEIIKGENIEVLIKKDNKINDDKLFFKTGFFNLKDNKFLAKDIVATLDKNLFGNNKNDPRIIAVSAKGDEFSTSFKKGVFTSCKKTDKCPPWKITAEKT